LSGGEQQRVGLARALVNNPPLIIADEPTGNVDHQMAHDIIQLLTQINENGTTVLMVTHEHELVHQFNHRVITLDKGHIVSDTGRPRRMGTVSLGAVAAERGGGEG
jgi:cell division transport system ATP-binding protein